MGIFRFDRSGADRRVRGEAERGRLRQIGPSLPPGAAFASHPSEQALRRVDGHLRLLARRAARDPARAGARARLRARVIPAALGRYQRAARSCTAATGPTWAPSESFYDANIMLTRAGCAFSFYDPQRPDLHAPAVPAAARGSADCTVEDAIVAEGCFLERAAIARLGRRHPHAHSARRQDPAIGAARRRLLRADRRGAPTHASGPSSASAATSCSTASSSTRTRASATAPGWSTSRRPGRADGDGYYIRERHHHRPEGRDGGARHRR